MLRKSYSRYTHIFIKGCFVLPRTSTTSVLASKVKIYYEDFLNNHLLGCFGVLKRFFGGGGSYPPTPESGDNLIF